VIWIWVVVLVVIIGAIAVVAAGRDEPMADVYDDRPDVTLPTGRPLTAEDLDGVRFSTAVRGYRMDEVDALLARIQADLQRRQHDDATPAQLPAGPTVSGEPLEPRRSDSLASQPTSGELLEPPSSDSVASETASRPTSPPA
jgi:DivIVA domain-containing protein